MTRHQARSLLLVLHPSSKARLSSLGYLNPFSVVSCCAMASRKYTHMLKRPPECASEASLRSSVSKAYVRRNSADWEC
ncbi:hypothetical protein ARMSODRAFT_468943 [Armillaria solidipes]|uniref:Uncharacterized protein n=1 Tax=Armillaria solidipes TaxID=1076256 RepID=A0A2H3B4G7_9AGAR|nr:hypothetical protein ARMSODRAFT_468943 [Armillaria solidipes]